MSLTKTLDRLLLVRKSFPECGGAVVECLTHDQGVGGLTISVELCKLMRIFV